MAKIGSSVNAVVTGMVGWLAAMTVAGIAVFIIVYKRLGRHDDEDTDAETGSIGGSTGDASSVIDFALFPALSKESLNSEPEKGVDTTVPVPCDSVAAVHSPPHTAPQSEC